MDLQEIIRKTVVETIRTMRGGRHRRKPMVPYEEAREFWSGAARQMYSASNERMNHIEARLEKLEGQARAQQQPREVGYYWVRVRGAALEIAFWTSHHWLITGVSAPAETSEIHVLSDVLSFVR